MRTQLLRVRPTPQPELARLRVLAGERSVHPVAPWLTGKFCEHLGANIYGGMHAQVLRNPTFADWPLGGGDRKPDGTRHVLGSEEAIAAFIREHVGSRHCPAHEIENLVRSRTDGLAFGWLRCGADGEVRPSPDVGAHGGRAQRVEVSAGGNGIAQWTWLPLHRVRRFAWRLTARSNDLDALRLTVTAQADGATVTQTIAGLGRAWRTFRGELEVPADAPPDAWYHVSLTTAGAGQFVIERLLLYPVDHVSGADPDVVRLLREARLPLLRWPGGNFVSAYHWRDGVGPVDERPTRPNLAWGGVEPNLFGTDEFVQFCRDVGCEPMICINIGSGTPREAAEWLEYCNGPADSPMGGRRAANGHPQPYAVHVWEIGNEIYGRHQLGWTTAVGNADRFREFVGAMRAVDSAIHVIANGAACLCTWRGEDWNGKLVEQCADILGSITDHVLVGGGLPAASDPWDLYRVFMAFPDAHERIYAKLRDAMRAGGVREPRLAITEMQLFARLRPPQEGEAVRLTRETMVQPATMAEAAYLALFLHMAARMAPFIEMITHSATVNHGGGLRKERERVYANPCHHAHAMLAAFHGATPVAVELNSPVERVRALDETHRFAGLDGAEYAAIDALAAVTPDNDLLVSLVHRGTTPLDVVLDLAPFARNGDADLTLLTADAPWTANTLDHPERIAPQHGTLPLTDGKATLHLAPCSIARLRMRNG